MSATITETTPATHITIEPTDVQKTLAAMIGMVQDGRWIRENTFGPHKTGCSLGLADMASRGQ